MSTSPNWSYFKKLPNEMAECYTCEKKLKTTGGSTKSLISHIQSHKNKGEIMSVLNPLTNKLIKNCLLPDESESEEGIKTSRKSSLVKFLRPEIDELVSRYAAQDGFSLNQIANSIATRGHARSLNLNLPKSPNTIRNLIFQYYGNIKGKIIKKIRKYIDLNKKLSISLDEWTSLSGERFLNVNVFFENTNINLGLKRLTQRATAKYIKECAEELLKDFGIIYNENIIGVSSDGASTMKCAFGKEKNVLNQLCLNHGIHLAIMDFFYSKKNEKEESDEKSYENFDEEEINDEKEFYETLEIINEEDECSEVILFDDIKEIISNVRSIIKKFKYSGYKKDLLKSIIEEKENKSTDCKNNISKDITKTAKNTEKSLHLDVKTRWNSLLKMLESFISQYQSIKETLLVLNEREYFVTEKQLEIIISLVDVLSPVKSAVELLSKKSCSILEGHIIMSTLLEFLETEEEGYKKKIRDHIKQRYDQRFNKTFVACLFYLENGNTNFLKDEFFINLTLEDIETFIIAHFQDESHTSDSNLVEVEKRETHSSFTEIFFEKIKKIKNEEFYQGDFDTIYSELQHLKTNKKLGNRLKTLKLQLSSIQSTSTSNERVFSTSGNFKTKIRSRMTPKLLNALVFLKFYFNSQKPNIN